VLLFFYFYCSGKHKEILPGNEEICNERNRSAAILILEEQKDIWSDGDTPPTPSQEGS
jgi:hypothetical protein